MVSRISLVDFKRALFIFFLIPSILLGQEDITSQIRFEKGEKFLPSKVVKAEKQINFETYHVEEGLIQSQVFTSLADSRGMLWFGTLGGVSRFDGSEFKNITFQEGLLDNIVRDIIEDVDGNIWIGGDAGITIFDGFSYRHIPTDSELIKMRLLDNGEIWVTLNNGLLVFDVDRNPRFYGDTLGFNAKGVRDLVMLEDESIVIGGSKGLTLFKEGKFEKFVQDSLFHNHFIEAMEMDLEGNVWVGTVDGIAKISPDGQVVNINRDIDQNDFINEIFVDKEGAVWCIGNFGIRKFDGNRVEEFDEINGLSHQRSYCAAQDKDGSIWFGTDAGIDKYESQKFVHFTKSRGLTHDVTWGGTQTSDGSIWIGSYNGLMQFKGDSIYHFKDANTFRKTIVLGAHETEDKKVWVATSFGLCFIDDGIKYTLQDSVQKRELVYCIVEDGQGDLWYGTNGGFVEYSNGRFFGYNTYNSGLGQEDVYTIAEDVQGRVWVGTQRGVYLLENGKIRQIEKEGIFENHICQKIEQDSEGNLWFAISGRGLYVLTAGNELKDSISVGDYIHISERNGLADNGVYVLKEDGAGNMWTGGNTAAVRINKEILSDTLNWSKFTKSYGRADGYIGLESNQGGLFFDNEGKFWMSCANRLTVYDPQFDLPHKVEAEPYLTDLRMFYEKVDWLNMTDEDGVELNGLSRFDGIPEKLILNHHQNHLTFDFSAKSYLRASKVEYRWKLYPIDNDWSPPSSRSDVTYPNLAYGNYTLYVDASNGEGVWNSIPMTYEFRILPPWWKTWWAYTLYISTALFLVYWFTNYRTRKLKQRQMELANEVRIKTKEVVQERDEAEKQRGIAEAQKLVVEEQHGLIKDSIEYALRIQQAILPPPSRLKAGFESHFVLYQPKDIVAGDFFWIEETADFLFFAAADCTGHGVPGAMLSVVCSNALTKCVKEHKIYSPAGILTNTSNLIENQFAHSEDLEDGMDIALCRLDKKSGEILFTGAHNPLWIFRKEAEESEKIKGDYRPVGKSVVQKPFSEHVVQLEKGDTIYIFSDGYIDQAGGPRKKKLMSTGFHQLLSSIVNQPMEEQHAMLLSQFEEWKGDIEQIDDVCVIGLKY